MSGRQLLEEPIVCWPGAGPGAMHLREAHLAFRRASEIKAASCWTVAAERRLLEVHPLKGDRDGQSS
jgi:hypothetical protein